MAGYNNFSKSNNAVEAESNGILPISEAAKVVAKKHKVTQKKAKAWFEANWGGEWHHYSKFYNEVKVYDTNLDADQIDDLLSFEEKKEEKETSTGQYLIKWIDWEGTRRHPKAINREFTGTAEIKGDWIYFDGKRKKLSGKHVEISLI